MNQHVKTIDGDLLKLAKEGKFDVIIHGCNCFTAMFSGLAGQIRKEYFEAVQADYDFDMKHPKEKKLGMFSYAKTKDKFIIVNAYTQVHASNYGEDVFEYEAFDKVLTEIHEKFPNARFGIPMIGAGLAHGDWNRIFASIDKHAGTMDCTIVYFKK